MAKSKKSPKSEGSTTTPKINGAVLANACLFHLTRAAYHNKAGRTDVAKQHETAAQTAYDGLNGARRKMVKMVSPILAPYSGPEVTEFQEFTPPERVEGESIGLDVPKEVKEALVAKAAEQGKSLRALVREILNAYLAAPVTPPAKSKK